MTYQIAPFLIILSDFKGQFNVPLLQTFKIKVLIQVCIPFCSTLLLLVMYDTFVIVCCDFHDVTEVTVMEQ